MKDKEYISKDPIELSLFFKVMILLISKDEGNKFYLKKDYDIAIIYFTKAIEMDSKNKFFYSNST